MPERSPAPGGRSGAGTGEGCAPAARRAPIRELVREAFRTQHSGVDVRCGIVGTLATVGPLVAGTLAGDSVAGLFGALGGLNASLGVPPANLRWRILWGTLATSVSLASLSLADLVGDTTWPLLVATFGWVGAAALLRAAGRAGAIAAFVISAVFVVTAGLPAGATPFETRILWYGCAAAAGLVLMVWARRGPAGPTAVGAALRAARHRAAHDRGLWAYCLRLAIAATIATALYVALDLAHGYWVPFTLIAILQPDEHATDVRAIQRTAGTLAGAALVIVITLITHAAWPMIACTAVGSFWLYALVDRGYFWVVIMVTPTILLMLSSVHFQGDAIGVERTVNSLLGIACGLAIAELGRRVRGAWLRARAQRRSGRPRGH